MLGVASGGSAAAPVLDMESFTELAQLVYRHAGIVLGERKRDLVQGRLVRRLRSLGLPDFRAYCALLASPAGEAEFGAMINAVTTNVTRFLREPHHFDLLRAHVLPVALAGQRLRIWSAGCSTGEEPYSIGMAVAAHAPQLAAMDARILATDIDSDVVARAAAGLYETGSADSIPPAWRKRFCLPAEPGKIGMAPAIRQLLHFRVLNLLRDWPMRGPFDAIFCRNVVIYFDKPTQRTLFERFAELLRPDGWLFIGHSETLHGISDRFYLAGRTAYRRLG